MSGVASYDYYGGQAGHNPYGGPSSSGGKHVGHEPQEEYDDEEDEDDDDDDEDEDEDDEEEGQPRKKAKKNRRKTVLNPFLDTEAVVDDDDEDIDEDDEELIAGAKDFIAEEDNVDEDDYDHRITAGHRRFAREEEAEQDLDRVAEAIEDRYKRKSAKYTGDSSDVPQRLLMPGVTDPSLWQVRVRPGKERDLVFQLMRKSLDMQFSGRPIEIYSAFERDSLPGMIYVEARSQQQVQAAVNGLVGVFLGRPITLVPIDEMASLLRIKKQVTTLVPGSWVRIKRGKYAGDLAQVIDVTDNGEEAGCKFIPRIDLTPREDLNVDPKKRKKLGGSNATSAFRPPQRFFNAEEVSKVFRGKVNLKPGHSRKFVFAGDTYNNGFIEKDIRITGLITENVNPTLEEITRFTHGDQENGDGTENAVDLSVIAEAARKAATVVLQPGDHVEVFEGEQTGMYGVVESILGEVVAIRAKHVDIEGQRIEVPASSVRKKFKAGDHVKVMAGKNMDETGLVVSVLNDIVTFLSDMTLQEVTVFAKDIREAAEVGAGTNAVGNYELHDLVQLDQQTVGVIYKTERDSFRVLDQNGQTRLVQPHQITMRKDSRHAIATDAQGFEIRTRDNMKELDGEQRKGQVLHIHQSHYAFLYSREITENGGVFVTRARGLVSVAPKGNASKPGGLDLSKMNPAVNQGGMAGSGMVGKSFKDRLTGKRVVVIKGPWKGYLGMIKDTNGNFARVELHTRNKVITIEKTHLRQKDEKGNILPLEGGDDRRRAGGGPNNGSMGPPSNNGWGGATQNPYTGSQTPRNGSMPGRTPNPYLTGDGSRTPWGAGMDGGRTPAGAGGWGSASSRTPNPFLAASKTPNPYGRTPNPYTSDPVGGRTPAGRFGAGGATPNPYRQDPRTRPGATPAGAGASSNNSNAWGQDSSNDPWGTGGGGWGADSAPTPGPISAPTPGGFANDDPWGSNNAQTPYGSAPTPYPSAPTPGVLSAPTPGAGGYYAQTPAAAGYAPTPAGGLAAPTPAAYAQTPGFGAGYGAADGLDQDGEDAHSWIYGLSNVWVEISPREDREDLPASQRSFQNGNYDYRKVVLLSVLDTRKNSSVTGPSNAHVRFQDGEERGTTKTIPVTFLIPVRPMAGDKAMVLSGPMEKRVMSVTYVDGQSAVGDIEHDGRMAEMQEQRLADLIKYQAPNR